MTTTIHSREIYPNAAVAKLGTQPDAQAVPDDTGCRTFVARAVVPAFAAFSCEYFRHESGDENAADLPFAQAWQSHDAMVACPKFPRGPICTDPAGVERRKARARELLTSVQLPAAGMYEETDTRKPTLEGYARRLLEECALAVGDTTEVLCTIAGVGPDEALTVANRMASFDHAIWQWDAVGKAADERARDEELARLHAEQAAVAERARRQAMNTKTADELGVVVTRRSAKAVASPLAPAPTTMMLAQGNVGSFARDGFVYFIFDKSTALGLSIPPGPFHDYPGEVLPGSYVPPLAVGEIESGSRFQLALDLARAYRRGRVVARPVTSFGDLRSADVAWALQCIRERFAPHFRAILKSAGTPYVDDEGVVRNSNPPASAFFPYIVHALAQTKAIRRDVAWSAFVEWLTPVWRDLYPETGAVTKPARVVYVDSLGHEHDEPFVRTAEIVPGTEPTYRGDPDRTREVLLDRFHEPMTRKTYPAVTWRTPPIPISIELFNSLYDQAACGGPDVLIGTDELFTPAPASFVEEHEAKLRPDPWRAFLIDLLKERTAPIRSADIEEALRGANLTEHLNDEGHARVARIMNRLGWVKKQPVIEGRRQAAYVRDGGE